MCYRTFSRSESNPEGLGTIPRRWINLTRTYESIPKLTKEASTSMEDLSFGVSSAPGSVVRPKSMCVPDTRYFDFHYGSGSNVAKSAGDGDDGHRRLRVRRNPVQRAASRLYRANVTLPVDSSRECVGPEFVVRASLPSKQICMPDFKGQAKKHVIVIMLNGQKLDVLCNPNSTTAGQLFEVCVQSGLSRRN